MLSLLKSFIKRCFIASFIFLLSCDQTSGNEQSNEKPSCYVVDKELIDGDYQEELQRNIAGLRQMEEKNQTLKRIEKEKEEAKRKEEEKRKKEKEIKDVKSWLIGTWEWTGYIWGQKVWTQLDISDDYIVSYTKNGIADQGSYRIDINSNKIFYGKYSYAKIDTQRKKIYADEGEPYRKVSNSPSFSANNGGNSQRSNNGYYGTTTFRTAADVINHTSSHTFRNNVGNSIKIDFHGMYVNGRLLTNAPRVLNFSSNTATISVSSPYTGGGAMIIRVDASRGTITDGSGDVFWMVN